MKNSSTVVFLHGWGVTPGNYQLLLDLLRQKHEIVAPNLSDITDKKSFSWKKFAENLDELVGERKVYLIGTSLGGGLALAYSALYPKKVKAIIVCEPVGIIIKRSKLKWALFFVKGAAYGLFFPGGPRIILRTCTSFFKQWLFNFRGMLGQAKLVQQEGIKKFLKDIEAPVYLLWSRNSDLIPLKIGEALHNQIGRSKYYPNFSNKKHFFILEQEKWGQFALKIFGQRCEKGE